MQKPTPKAGYADSLLFYLLTFFCRKFVSMNNELKCALKAVLLVLLFFGAIGFISFILATNPPVKQEPVNNIDWAMRQLQTASNDPKFEKGKLLFASNCTACHRLNKTDAMPLADVETRIPDKNCFIHG